MVLSLGPVRNSLKVAITNAVVKFSLERLSDNFYWNDITDDFDLGAEPTLLDAVHIRDGIYLFAFPAAYSVGKNRYRIHVTVAGVSPTTQDYGFDVKLGPETTDVSAVWDAARASHNMAGTFGEYAPVSLERIKGLTTVDGIDVGTMFENFIAALQGEVDRPGAANVYEYKKQGGSIAFTLTVSTIGRTAS